MKISTLMENTEFNDSFKAEHGLSLFIETKGKRILFDMGQTDAFACNAEKLGIDLKDVDFAVLSHGHYDHGGGLKHFLEINSEAPVYLSPRAFEPHFNGTEKYIGLDTSLKNSDRLIYVKDETALSEDIFIYPSGDFEDMLPFSSFGLNMLLDGKLMPDDFRHEQYLLIRENNKSILFSGCSHRGILNIVNRFEPDVLVGGFHFKKLDPGDTDSRKKLESYANALAEHHTKYYTCHCTGTTQYEFLKGIMGTKLEYLSAGQTAEI